MKHLKEYNSWSKETKNDMTKGYKMNHPETFREWFKRKTGIEIGEHLGDGSQGVVYDISNNRVIKFSSTLQNNQEPLLNKKVPGVAKVYQTGLIRVPDRYLYINNKKLSKEREDLIFLSGNPQQSYIILEKLYDLQLANDKVESAFWEFGELIERMEESDEWIDFLMSNKFKHEDIENILDKIESLSYSPSVLMFELSKFYNLLDLLGTKISDYNINTYRELQHIFSNISRYYNWNDIHAGQFGYDKNGDLKAFDISDRNELYVQGKDIFKTRQVGSYKQQKNIVKESRQRGMLYHYTSLRNLISMLKTNTMIGRRSSSKYKGTITQWDEHYISFTRDKNLHLKDPDLGDITVRVCIDGDKLSNNYRLIPFRDFTYNMSDTNYRHESDESEERVLFGSRRPWIDNLSKYIVRVDLTKDAVWTAADIRKYLSDLKGASPSETIDDYINNKENKNQHYTDEFFKDLNSVGITTGFY
jgi:hypothetical protein